MIYHSILFPSSSKKCIFEYSIPISILSPTLKESKILFVVTSKLSDPICTSIVVSSPSISIKTTIQSNLIPVKTSVSLIIITSLGLIPTMNFVVSFFSSSVLSTGWIMIGCENKNKDLSLIDPLIKFI